MQKFVTKGSEGGSTGIHGLLKVGGGGSKCDFLLFVCLCKCKQANMFMGFSDLSSDQNLSLDPLMLLAAPILKPNPDDPGVQTGHLGQLLLWVVNASFKP